MRIFGIDPGTGKLGYGMINIEAGQMRMMAYGCIKTPAHMPLAQRLCIIYQEFKKLISDHKPDMVAIEKLFFARNVTTAMGVGEARGVVVLAAAQANIEIQEFTPLQVKQAITGYGRAEKSQIQRMVQKILNLEKIPRPDDAADALAIAITAAAIASKWRGKNA